MAMFSHVFRYRLKILLREKTLVFWTLIFPFILSTLFHLVFSRMSGSVQFSPIPIAVVDNETDRSDPFFTQALAKVSTGENRLFDLLDCPDAVHAQTLLKEGKIRGYIQMDNPVQWHISRSGLSQSMVKSFLDQVTQLHHAVQTVLSRNPSAFSDLLAQLGEGRHPVKTVRGFGAKADLILILYYALLAMSCLYGAYYGLSLAQDVQGDLSARAARLNMVPMPKLQLFMSGLAASFVVHMGGLLLFLAYLNWLIGIDFGRRAVWVVATMIMGSITGLSLGAFVAVVVRGKEGVKVATLSTVTLLGAFLAGMMAPGIKYQIATSLPLLSWLNPVNLLADAFYALYYYDDFMRYGQNMALLMIFTLLFGAGAYLLIRRRQYVSL